MTERKIRVYGPPVGGNKSSYTTPIFELDNVKEIISDPKYPIDRQGYLFLLCSIFEEAARTPGQAKVARELGIILLEEAGLVPVRVNRGIDLKPAA